MNRFLCIFGLLLALRANYTAAQDAEQTTPPPGKEPRNSEGLSLEDMLPAFRNQAVVLDINARVIEQNTQEIWHESHRRVTIPGRPVEIKLVGSNVIVAAQFIPYLRRNGQNILVAQGQIWVDVPNQGIRYQTAMQTIPLAFNEPVYFFPLGSGNNPNEARIEIQLTMRPYRDSDAPETAAPEQPTDNANQGNNPP
jgi:hypothetical protein